LVGWFVACLVACLDGWLLGWLVSCLVAWLIGWSDDDGDDDDNNDDWWLMTEGRWLVMIHDDITMTRMFRLSRRSRSRCSISCLHQCFGSPFLALLPWLTWFPARQTLWQFSVAEPCVYPRPADQSSPIAGNLVAWIFCYADSTHFSLTWSNLHKWLGKSHAGTSRSPSCSSVSYCPILQTSIFICVRRDYDGLH
jgi:hypothetical protein